MDNHRQWHEELSFSLLGYCTTMRTSTGEMPDMLVYGTEAVIAAEFEIPSLRIIQKAKLYDAEWIRVRKKELMLIDEKSMNQCAMKPLIGRIKVNTDGSYFKETRRAGIGGIVRDQQGELIMAFSLFVKGKTNNIAEAMSTKMGI
ncbi:uncharacterized protein LOC142168120 [Nicotiana tabacum]|uniref:Uncharacterized protein LOC142168120 n=1 Tax=Nicotiana tabacum TaxID=4097 RepID=A0AC58SIT2_TOBAC